MWKAPPDPGVLTCSHNAFAANDPDSSEQLWNMALKRFSGIEKRIVIFNCRTDRAYRSGQLGRAVRLSAQRSSSSEDAGRF
ncbi:MAG: hypothetical protein WCY54_03790 [Syntrophales bacterium]